LPKVIVLDRDPKFKNAFWLHFSRKVRMKPKFSTAFHSQMVGKPERMNGILKQYLRNSVGVDQRDWADYVGRAELCCNVAMHLVTKGSSFVMACGVRCKLLT
jgi:hypothetical protein